jgi:hypothetical protein
MRCLSHRFRIFTAEADRAWMLTAVALVALMVSVLACAHAESNLEAEIVTSDMILIGTITSQSPTASFVVDPHDPKTTSYDIVVHVERVLSGQPASDVTIRTLHWLPKAVAGARPDDALPWNIVVGGRYLFFLDRASAGIYDLSDPGRGYETAYRLVGPPRPAETAHGVFCDVVTQMVPAISGPDLDERFTSIYLLTDFDMDVRSQPAPTGRAAAFSSPADWKFLATCFRDKVEPAILATARDSNTYLADRALTACAKVNRVDALPIIMSVANGTDPDRAESAAGDVAWYPPDLALPRLVALVRSPSKAARIKAAMMLQDDPDRRALPGLLDALPDADLDTSYRITFALSDITNVISPTDVAHYTPAEEDRYKALWKAWAATHKAELAYLSHSFDTDPHASDRGRHEQPASP